MGQGMWVLKVWLEVTCVCLLLFGESWLSSWGFIWAFIVIVLASFFSEAVKKKLELRQE